MRENASEIGPLPAILVTALTLLLGIGSVAAVSPPGEADSSTNNWLADVQRGIASAEYSITLQSKTGRGGPAWQAPNRAQGFRTYFEPSAIRLTPRSSADKPAW